MNFLFLLAEDLRGIMAEIGFRTIEEMVGRTDVLEGDPTLMHEGRELDFTKILLPSATLRHGAAQFNVQKQDHGLEEILDRRLIQVRIAFLFCCPVLLSLIPRVNSCDIMLIHTRSQTLTHSHSHTHAHAHSACALTLTHSHALARSCALLRSTLSTP